MKTKTTATLSERSLICVSGEGLKPEDFVKVAEQTLDSLTEEFRNPDPERRDR
jgi:hypothetical protein